MLTREQLLAARCRALPAGEPALGQVEIAAQLQALPDWRLDEGALVRAYRFADYYRTLAFVNALAYVAHAEDHHPDLRIGYDRCEVRFNTHSIGGISLNDFICAAKADALFAQGDRGIAR